MVKINVKEISADDKGWKFEVEISEKDSKTKHEVVLSKEYYEKLITDNEASPGLLVEKSIGFLLEREPKESILAEFDLKIIKNYFPEYEDEILVRF